MKAGYKNKRDQYKAESEQCRRELERAQLEAKNATLAAQRLKEELNKKAEESKKRYDAIVYCTNCLHVNSVSIPPSVRIDEGDCTTCRVRGTLKLVITYPGKL